MSSGMSIAGVLASTALEAPLVSALADGDTNSGREDVFPTVTCGVQFNIDGDEYECTNGGTFNINVGTWLDAGTPGQVWVAFTRTAGQTDFDSLTSGVRYRININRTFSLDRSTVGSDTITGFFSFYDEGGLGGNLLDSTSSATWTATQTADPCPLCCFTPDTPVTLASGIEMPIGKVREGDLILVWDKETNMQVPAPVTDIIVRERRAMYRVDFEDGRYVRASDDHPFDVAGKGPASINPVIEYKDLGKPAVLNVGDQVTLQDMSQVRITRITQIDYPGPVYTFENSLFYANGILVY